MINYLLISMETAQAESDAVPSSTPRIRPLCGRFGKSTAPFMWGLLFIALTGCQSEDMPLPSACEPLSEDVGDPAARFVGDAPSNLLVISIDTLRRDEVGIYSGRETTPFLDQRLTEGVRLDNFRACSNWTLPSIICAITGQSTLELGLEPMLPDELDEPDYFDPDMQTLAFWLAEAGWKTALVTGSKLFTAPRPTANGFSHVALIGEGSADELADTARGLIPTLQADPEIPWYLHIHFRDPHSPYNPPKAWQGALADRNLGDCDPRTEAGLDEIADVWSSLEDDSQADLKETIETLYRGEIRFLDEQIAELWADLDAAGMLEDTLVVFWSDHGEQFFEHDNFQHSKSLHQEESAALGGLWAKNIEPDVFSGPTAHQDIPPTILDILGVEIPASITGEIIGTMPDDRIRISNGRAKSDVVLHSVERNGHLLLYSWLGERSYYKVPHDPKEEYDLYKRTDENIACLWDIMRPVLDQVDAGRVGYSPINPE